MRQFDFYEFTGFLVPGATALVGAMLLFPNFSMPAPFKDISVGGLGLFVIIAYVVGHLIQAVGNAVEWLWWKLWGGMPTDWLRTKPSTLLGSQQLAALHRLIHERLGLRDLELNQLNRKEWYAITRQVYASVSGAGRAARIDTFNGNYGLNRGIAAGLLVVTVLVACAQSVDLRLLAVVLIAAALALYRMHRFARHYACELFVQFLQLPVSANQKDKTL